jgi:transcriptional regulator with XRE-family HTH domain
MTQKFKWEAIVDEAIHARIRQNLRQSDVSEISGVSKPIVVNFEKKRTNIKVANIIKILQALRLEQNQNLERMDLLNWEQFTKTATERRYFLCMTKSKLSELAGISLNLVIDFEKGLQSISLSNVIRILTVLDLTNSKLLDSTNPVRRIKTRVDHKKV